MESFAPSPFEAAFTPGARFVDDRGGIVEMSVRTLGELRVPTGRIIVCDPFTTPLDQPGTPFSRRSPTGTFPVELALAHLENGDQRVACARVRFEQATPTRWEVASFEGEPEPVGGAIPGYGVDAGMGCFFDEAARGKVAEEKIEAWLAAAAANETKTWTWHADELHDGNVIMFSSGWGDGFYGSYWGLDGDGRVVELVTDFEVLLGPDSEQFELPLPLGPGGVSHPLLNANDLTLRGALFSRTKAVVGGKGTARLELSNGAPVEMQRKGDKRIYTWKSQPEGARLVVRVMVGIKPFDRIRTADE